MSPGPVIVVRVLAALGFMLVNGIVVIVVLRKVLARLHVRGVPDRVGLFGLLQTVADGIKLLTKEDSSRAAADRVLFGLAPFVAFVPALAAYAAIPFSDTWHITDLDAGLLYTLAALSLVPIGGLMAGWASHDKWSLLGGIHAAVRQMACEVPLLIACLGPVMIAGSANLGDIVRAQEGLMLGFIPRWFVIPQIGAFLLFGVAALAQLDQTPFAVREAEGGFTAGFSDEYSGVRFGLLFLAEFSSQFVVSALAVALFFGGWLGGFGIVPAPIVFLVKTYIGIAILAWIREALPRPRIDQVLSLVWKGLVPLSLAWIVLTGILLRVVG